MQSFTMTCVCGDEVTLEAETRPAAVEMFKSGMTQEALDQHFAAKHPGQPKPTLEQAKAGIDQMVPAGA